MLNYDKDNLRQNKSRFFYCRADARSTNLVREVKNLSPKFIRIALRCFALCIILIRIDPFYRKTLISSAKNNVQIACEQLIELTFPYN